MFIIKLRKELKGEAHMIINATNSQINHTAVCHSHKELFDWVGRKDPSVPHWQTTQRKQTMGTEQRHYTEQGTHKSLKFSIVLKVFTTAIKSRQSCRLQMQFNSQVWRWGRRDTALLRSIFTDNCSVSEHDAMRAIRTNQYSKVTGRSTKTISWKTLQK